MKKTTFCGKRFLVSSLTALGFSALSSGLFAQPVVTYSVSGTSGDYSLDFTINNATPGTDGQWIYFMGVDDVNGTVTGVPSPFAQYTPFSPLAYDGAGGPLLYNDVWLAPDTDGIVADGTSLSGFTVLDTSATAPTSLPYFAYGYEDGASYTGPDNLDPRDNSFNPLFEGNAAGGAGAPDSGATFSLLGLALGALGGVSRKLRKA